MSLGKHSGIYGYDNDGSYGCISSFGLAHAADDAVWKAAFAHTTVGRFPCWKMGQDSDGQTDGSSAGGYTTRRKVVHLRWMDRVVMAKGPLAFTEQA